VEALQTAPDVIDAAVFGNALHLVVRDAAAATPQIAKYLAQQGIVVERMETIHPSLEDVFVSLTTAREAGEERQA
jgi:ABC-2 type transport system ATP-binding protein